MLTDARVEGSLAEAHGELRDGLAVGEPGEDLVRHAPVDLKDKNALALEAAPRQRQGEPAEGAAE